MAFRKFTTNEYTELRAQHNVMALVGNGFDIQVTRKHLTRFSPRYQAFYHYLQARDFDSVNPIVRQMESLRETGNADWSDLEGAIAALLTQTGGSLGAQVVYEATAAIQEAFSEYLELVAPPELLATVGKESSTGSSAIRSMSEFVGDVATTSTFEKFRFPEATEHYHLFNFLFINFNYTPLLDDYLYRDAGQWEPHGYTWADRNFPFRPNPTGHADASNGNERTAWSSYLRTELVHPHGQQAIPRSLLFGIDAPDGFNRGTHPHKKLMKPYWAMTDIEYGHLFADTELFIIFGCSLGATDGWWWRRILGSLAADGPGGKPSSEVIIYWWSGGAEPASREAVVERFLGSAGVQANDPIRRRIQDQIHVVAYTDLDPPVWLAT